MGFQYSCLIIQRIILPIIFIICCLGRPVGTSLVYLLMYFILPFIPIANSSNLNGLVTAYFIILIALSSLILTAHIGLQIAIAIVGPELIQKCSFEEILLRHIGFIRFNDFQVLAIVEWILLDIIFFLTTIIIYVIIKKLVRRDTPQSSNVEVGDTIVRTTSNNLVNFQSIIKVAPALCLASLFLTAVFRPSLIGGIYFLVFLFTSTYWAFYKSFGRGFGILMRAVMFILVFHIIAIVSYQTPWAQEYLNNSSLPARLTALEPLALSTCRNDDDIRQLSINSNLNIDSYLSPIMVLLSYYILALTSKCLISKKVTTIKLADDNVINFTNIHIFLMLLGMILIYTSFTKAFQKRTGAFAQFQKVTKLNRQVSYIRQPANFTKKNSWERVQKLSVLQSIESPDELSERTPLVRKKRASEPKTPKGDAIPLETVGEVPEEQNYVWLDQIWYIFQGIGEFIYQNSYIFTNIIMMAWSIIYHSWLTFVLLIWSNILWMIPNQRKAMLRSSPFIVLYAELLVTAQYIYGMNFEGEIPGTQSIRPDMDNATRISIEKEKKYFAQIGFEHPDRMPCLPIIVKTLFTIMFWTTLRQLFKESKDKKRTSALADMVAPLQLTVGAATSDLAPQSEVKKKPKFFDNAGNYLKDLLIKAWIWLLILIIFLCGLIGQTMTGFRIFYMALFLTFVLIFQCSWKVWLKMMYGFWLFLIVYAMATLILIYTYQFDGFTTYWHDYFGISPTLQNDIGLKVYVTKDLFLHLVTPTLILIMTIVQVHYVHKRFVEGLQKQETEKKDSPALSRKLGDLSLNQLEIDEPKESTEPKEKSGRLAKLKKKFSKKKMETFMGKLKQFLKNFQEFSWMFLELHLLKAVFIVAFIVCVAEVCVLHISIVLLCVIALVLKQSAQIFISRIISILVSIFIISKMIYQVDYINHSKFDVQCNNNQTTDVNNTAEWIGLDKIESGTSLMKLLRRYLIYMIFSTLHAVVVFRQFHKRKTANTESLELIVIFPKITRLEAERNLLNLLKYLVNYGYFKFGLELTLIILVGLIGYRQDMYAILYAFWLCLLINLSRAKCAKAWPFFQGYTGFVLILQYFQFVGIPPGLCYEFLYENFGQAKILGVWAVLPGPYLGGTARRMLFDFILLLFIARQSRVFNLEAKIKRTNEEFAGGTNEPIIENYDDIDNEKFVNPTHDFTTNVRNWLDIVKNAILLGWFWVTLAVVFLAGTSSASLLSLGYLIGSFAFLWQGSDFYLRPINTILKWWYVLIHYNVAVITVKTVIQLGGCLFYDELKSGANWFVYLLGVSCLKYNQHQENAEEHVELFEKIDTYFGLSWDAICFVFLIFQLRIFKSYYFIHIINDTKADTILASRGAEIIEDLRQKQIEHKHKHEKGVLVKIKMKMEKIRATQRKMFRPIEKQTHLQDAAAPLVRSNSISSCQGSGYHTPIEDQDENKNFASDIQSDLNGLLPVSTPGLQAASPSSAVLTVSLEGYLEPQRISLGSPPTSDINAPGSDDTFPVFSPISYASPEASTQAQSLIPPQSKNVSSSTQTGTLQTSHHRRKSSINTVSWIEPVEDSSKGKTFKSPSDTEAQSSILRTRSLYRQQLSMPEESMYINQRRRFSNLSWANEESVSVRTTSLRPYSWGPVGNMYYLESLISEGSFPTSHAESVRAGDYYMFDDPDEKIELDLLHSAKDFLADDDKITETERKISKRKTLFEVLKELELKKKEEFQSTKKSTGSLPTLQLGPKEAKRISTRSAVSDPLPITPKYDLDGQAERPKTPVKPSSSKTQDGEGEEVEEGEEEQDGQQQEQNVILRILSGTLVSFAIRLHRLSRNYRYVMKILSEEKKMLKETEGFGEGKLIGSVGKWPPSEDEQIETLNSQTHIDKNIDNKSQTSSDESESDIKINTKENDDYTTLEPSFRIPKIDTDSQRLSAKLGRRTSVVPEIRILAPSLERGLDESAMLEIHSSQEQIDSDSDFELEDDGFIARDHHIVVEVCIALWYAILSNTDLICYFIVFVNQVASASILSLPLPIMAFLWGTLTIPRPSKTFWVTLIAYTQCVVIIKCIFQYKMIWIDHQSLPNEPLAAEKIIGIEQKDNYATFDLILLLVLFFHRFVLKSQGLWKSETRNNESVSQLLNDDPGPENDVIVQRESGIDAAEKDVQLSLDPSEHSIADPDDVSLQISEKKSSRPHVPEVLKIKSTKYLSSITDFHKNLIHKPRLPADVYACMFLCEFTNFFILLFGFTAFSAQQGDGGVSEYLAENKVPLPFLIMLLLQFCLIIIDRALYLRKALIYKILFHYCSVFGIHIWMFFVIPAVTEARFNSLKPPIIFYMIKCIYLLLSSYQIRSGYPKRILGNFLTKGYSVVNMASFKLYKLTPFLYELRTFLDWVCTETTMTLWDWLKMEDIFSEIYFIKCSRELEETFPVMRATKKPMISKILVGGTFILVIVIIIWAPLALFALSSAVGYANVPTAIQATLKIGSYEPIYTADVKDNIKTFSKENLTSFLQLYIKDKYAVSFITGYDAEDVATIELPANSANTWEISPPDKERLIDDLIQNRTLTCRFSYSLFRVPPNDKSSDKISGETRFEITPEFPSRKNLIAMLQGQSVEGNVTIPDMLPKFLKVKNNNLLSTIHQLQSPKYPEYSPFVLKLNSLNGSGLWWEIRDCLENEDQINSTLPFANCEKMVIYTFSDKKFPSTFSFFTAGGIIGMYTTFVILVSRYLRTGFSGSSHIIQFVDLPYVDRMLQMCLDVYLVREAKEFALEEDLFAKLIFLYRSPETRIKWSRLKEKSITASAEGFGSKRSLSRSKQL